MILKQIADFIKQKQRVEEKILLKHFRLTEQGLAPFMDKLIKTGFIQKTVNQRGASLSAQVFYSWRDNSGIPLTTVL